MEAFGLNEVVTIYPETWRRIRFSLYTNKRKTKKGKGKTGKGKTECSEARRGFTQASSPQP